MNAEAQAGFKQTALGTLPVGWDVVPLQEICWFQEGPGLRKWQFTSRGMKVINVTNLVGEILDLDKTDRHISFSEFSDQYQHFAIDENDIVMASSGNSYGKIALVRGCDLPLMMNTSVIRFKPKERTCFSYIWTFLRSDFFKSQIDLMITGGAQPNFGPYHLNRILVQLPPLSEQVSISEALTEQDNIIRSLDQLIAKKRDIRQGVMQQLLTGQRRLPGFSGEWEVKRLGDVVEIKKGQLITEKLASPGDIPVVAGGKKPAYFHSAANRSGKNITISASGASAGYVAFFETPIFASDCSTIGESDKYEITFVYYALRARQEEIYKAQTGGAQPHIHPIDLYPLVIAWPDKAEQTAIATILSDMHTELAALEARREKARMLKQGMMQELLTGRIRLIDKESV